MEADDRIELRKILGPAGLTMSKDLGHGEVLKILMIRDHVNRNTQTFEVVPPNVECLKHCEFFVMGVIVEFQCRKCAGMKGHRVDFTGVSLHGEDGSEGIVRGIGFHNERFVGDPMG